MFPYHISTKKLLVPPPPKPRHPPFPKIYEIRGEGVLMVYKSKNQSFAPKPLYTLPLVAARKLLGCREACFCYTIKSKICLYVGQISKLSPAKKNENGRINLARSAIRTADQELQALPQKVDMVKKIIPKS